MIKLRGWEEAMMINRRRKRFVRDLWAYLIALLVLVAAVFILDGYVLACTDLTVECTACDIDGGAL